MNTLASWLSILFLLGFTSCSGGKDIEAMDREIMVLHDEVMPLMVDMKKKRTLLEEKSMGIDSTQMATFRDAIRDLKIAEDGMWDWMNQYKKQEIQSDEELKYMENASYSNIINYFHSRNINSYLTTSNISNFIERFTGNIPKIKLFFNTFTEIYSNENTTAKDLITFINEYESTSNNSFNLHFFKNMPTYFMCKT